MIFLRIIASSIPRSLLIERLQTTRNQRQDDEGKMAATDGSALGAQALINPRWVEARAELNEFGHKATESTTYTEGVKRKSNKNSASKLTHSQPGTVNNLNPPFSTEHAHREALPPCQPAIEGGTGSQGGEPCPRPQGSRQFSVGNLG